MDGEKRGVLEVKCPWKYRDFTIAEAIEKKLPKGSEASSFYLTEEGDLRKGHNYWHQIQGEMAAIGIEVGDFVVWTKRTKNNSCCER